MAQSNINIGGNNLSNFTFNIGSDGSGGVSEYVQLNLKIKVTDGFLDSTPSRIGFEVVRVDTDPNYGGNGYPHTTVCDTMETYSLSNDNTQTLIGFITDSDTISELTSNSTIETKRYGIKIKYKYSGDSTIYYFNPVFVIANSQFSVSWTTLSWNLGNYSRPYTINVNQWNEWLNPGTPE